ncbi:hypothetical protein [Pseudomonas fragariae (ex Marin et al. 2024)]|uniref:hypothetical protein n=1 Tax=Pseudomonas fragariae (ex Marin et al. 2024) TaxID=3080056 RepID=UPI003F7B091B
MQSYNYVQGVSGWKMHSNGTLEVNGKIRAIMVEQVDKPETPFTVQGDQVFLHKTFIDAAAFEPAWRVRTSTSADGQVIASGMGLGYACEGVYTGTPDEKTGEIAVTVEGVQYINRNLIKGEAARLVADEIIAACAAAKQ